MSGGRKTRPGERAVIGQLRTVKRVSGDDCSSAIAAVGYARHGRPV